MKRKQDSLPDLEKYLKDGGHRYVTYEQGARLYRLPFYSFVRVAKEAKANYLVSRAAIVDLDILEQFVEENEDVAERIIRTRRSYLCQRIEKKYRS